MRFQSVIFTRRRVILACFTFGCLFVLVNVYTSEPTVLQSYSWDSNRTDILPSVESVAFSPPPDSIFFLETSDCGCLGPRQACTVEAAARAHPQRRVHVLFAAPVSTLEGSLNILQELNNVHFVRIHISDFVKGTPVEKLITDGTLAKSQWVLSHTSDVLRYTTLYKWSGVYLDLDAIVVKPLDSLEKNWAARESDDNVAAGALAFSSDPLGRHIAELAIRDIGAHFRGDLWGHNGPGVITRVLKSWCSTTTLSKMSRDKCKGFEVYGPDLFYPVSWQNSKYYFKAGELNFPSAVVYHVWNHRTADIRVQPDSRYANITRQYCPTIYNNYPDEFGHKKN